MSGLIKNGGCLCGNVRYQFSQSDSLTSHHCHCKDCQKSTGSGKATILLIPKEALEIEGDLKFYSVTGKSGSHVTRGFCENCGSPVMSFVEENPDLKFIKAGSLDDSSWISIASNFWSSTANQWSPTDKKVHSFTHNPEFP